MTRELIEDFAKIVKPFVQKRLLEENFEGMGEQDKAEFGRDFDEILSLAIKGLDQEPCEDAVSRASVFEIMGNLLSIPYDFDRSITEKDVSESMDKIRELPRVTPQEPRKIY